MNSTAKILVGVLVGLLAFIVLKSGTSSPTGRERSAFSGPRHALCHPVEGAGCASCRAQ